MKDQIGEDDHDNYYMLQSYSLSTEQYTYTKCLNW